MNAERPGSPRRVRVIVAGVAAIAVLAVLSLGLGISGTQTSSSVVEHSAKILYDGIPSGQNSPYWAVEVFNSGEEPIVGISIVRVVVTEGNQTTSLTGIQSGPFDLVTGSANPECFPGCGPGALGGQVSVSLPLNPSEDAYTSVSSTDSSQLFEDCGAQASPCVVNVLVTYADGEVGILDAPFSSG